MTAPRRWRIDHWSPWPPDESGVAVYCDRLLPELAKLVDVTVVHPSTEDHRYRTRRPNEAREVNLDGGDVDIFHLGNNLAYHHWMLAPLLRRGGIVVLHDWSLYDMVSQLYERAPGRWAAELAYNGEAADVTEHREAPNFLMDHPLNRRFLRAADVVVTHSAWLAEHARALHPGLDVRHIPHASLVADSTPLPDDGPVVVLGGVGRHKKVPWAIEALALLADRLPTLRLRIVGRADDPWEVGRLRDQAADLEVSERVEWHLDASRTEYLQHIRESLLVLALRGETAGETSGAMKEAWGIGRVVITSDQPQFREYDERFCRRAPLGDEAPAAVARMIADALSDRTALAAAGRAAHDMMAAHYTYPQVAAQYAALVDEVAQRRPRGALAGLNLYGSWGTPSGIAEVARRLATALDTAGVPMTAPPGFQLLDYEPRLVPRAVARLPRAPEFAINLLTANINEFHEIPTAVLGNKRDRRWNIGLWIYEFPEIPPVLAQRVRQVDEIWTGSEFAAAAFRRYFNGPILRLHNIVIPRRARTPVAVTRARLGLRPTATVVLFSFDFGSGWARKNPLAVVRAFREARLHSGADAQLVIKASGLAPPYRAMLRNELATTDGQLLDAHLSDDDLGDLFHAVDVYCSLHRAEGFGLGLAESMALGKLAIATRYSGNLDFMNDGNSLLVDCAMTRITARDAAPNPGLERIVLLGSPWAEPQHQSAVDALTRAFDPELRAKLGAQAKADLRARFSAEAAASIVTTRLEELRGELLRFRTTW